MEALLPKAAAKEPALRPIAEVTYTHTYACMHTYGPIQPSHTPTTHT